MKFYPAQAKPDQIKVALDDAMLLFEHNPKVVLSGCELPEGASREDVRAKSVCDPALGTGRMLLCASNYSLRLYGMDINQTVIKACLVNGYLYAPWMVKAFDFLDTYNEQGEATPHLQQQSSPPPLLPPATTAEVKGQMEWALA